MVHDPGGGVANVQENLKESAMLLITCDKPAQRLRVPEGGQRPVNGANNLAEIDAARRALQPIATLGAALAIDQTGSLELKENELQEFLRDTLRGSDLVNSGRMLRVVFPQGDHGFQSVEAFL